MLKLKFNKAKLKFISIELLNNIINSVKGKHIYIITILTKK